MSQAPASSHGRLMVEVVLQSCIGAPGEARQEEHAVVVRLVGALPLCCIRAQVEPWACGALSVSPAPAGGSYVLVCGEGRPTWTKWPGRQRLQLAFPAAAEQRDEAPLACTLPGTARCHAAGAGAANALQADQHCPLSVFACCVNGDEG